MIDQVLKSIWVVLGVWVSLAVQRVDAQDGALPDSLSAAIIVKVLAFESSDHGMDSMCIHVMDNEELAHQLKEFEGSKVRGRVLSGVTYGASISPQADVVVASGRVSLVEAVSYAKSNRAISVTNNPKLIELGAALIVFDDEGLPGILLNLDAAKREGLYWEPEILHIARIVEN